jgi:hypothetical protein
MHRAGTGHARHAAKHIADEQDTEMRLARIPPAPIPLASLPLASLPLAGTAPNTHMAGVVRAVVRDTQHLGRERGAQRCRQSFGPV